MNNKYLHAATFILLTGFIVLLFNSGSRFAMGLLLKPMADDLSWSRSTLSLGVTAFMTVTALSLPLVGRAVDRFRARPVLIGGILLTIVSLGLMTVMQSPLQAVVIYGLLFGLGSAATSVIPIGVMITRRFPERAGFANSIAISGMGIGQLLIISGLTSQLDAIGWRGAFLLLAALNLLILLPLVVSVTRSETQPDCANPPASPAAEKPPFGSASAQSSQLWVLLLIYAICGFQDFFVATHVVAFALDQGVGSALAGNMLALMGLCGLLGVLITGAWSDRGGPIAPTLACFVLRALLFAVVFSSRETPIIVTFALLYGMTFWVTAPLVVIFVRQGFGVAQLGALSGLITMVHHLAGGLGAYVGAALFDKQGNYDNVFQLMLLLSVLASVLTYVVRLRHRIN